MAENFTRFVKKKQLTYCLKNSKNTTRRKTSAIFRMVDRLDIPSFILTLSGNR